MTRTYIAEIQNFLIGIWDGTIGGSSMLVKTKESEIEGVWLIYDQEEYYLENDSGTYILYCRIYIYRNGELLGADHNILAQIFGTSFPMTNRLIKGSFKFSWIGSNLRTEAILDFPVVKF